jgi:hypothetical protein
MAFAFKFDGMLSFASCVALAATLSATGCIATSPVEFTGEENYPPSVVSDLDAEYPLREIGQLNLDDPVEIREVPLQVIVRDPNIDQTLEFRIFLDSLNPPETDFIARLTDGFIDPSGDVERPRTFTIPYDSLTPGQCHKIELTVVGNFAGFVDLRAPVDEGDIDNSTWWIEVTDADNPVITVECR